MTTQSSPDNGQPDDGAMPSDDTDSDDDRVALATAELRAAEEAQYPWRVESDATETCAGLDILRFSSPIVQQAGLTWGVGERRIPALGSVSVAVVLAGDVFYIPRVLICPGMEGGVWSPSWAATRGIRTHLNFGPRSPESWLVTPSGNRVPLSGVAHLFSTSFARHRLPDELRGGHGPGVRDRQINARRGGVVSVHDGIPPTPPHATILDIGPRAAGAVIGGCLARRRGGRCCRCRFHHLHSRLRR